MTTQSAPRQEHDEETAKDLLRRYVFYERTFSEQVFVPHRIPPHVASQFLQDEVKADAKVNHLNHAGNTARFYRLYDCLTHFADFLSRDTAKVPDACRSVESVNLLGDLGDDADRQTAYDQWERLTKHRKVEQIVSQLIASFYHLGPGVSEKPLVDVLEAKSKAAAGQPGPPEPGQVDPAEMDDLVHRKMVRAAAAKKNKEIVLGNSRADRRAGGLARMYLALADHPQFCQEWAGYELIAEAERSDPQTVVEALRQTLHDFERTSFGDDRELAQKTKEDGRARACDAIVFFGGELNEDEQKLLVPDPPGNIFTAT